MTTLIPWILFLFASAANAGPFVSGGTTQKLVCNSQTGYVVFLTMLDGNGGGQLQIAKETLPLRCEPTSPSIKSSLEQEFSICKTPTALELHLYWNTKNDTQTAMLNDEENTSLYCKEI